VNIPVKARDCFIPVDFVVVNMDIGDKTPLILGRPFLSTADAQIDVGVGVIRPYNNGREEKFEFRLCKEQCSMVKGMPRRGTLAQDVDLIQTQVDNLIALTDNSRRQKPEQLSAERKRHRGSTSQSK
jgi:hypothetical protein